MLGVAVMCMCGGSSFGFNAMFAELPSPAELKARQFHFQTTTIFDRNGDPLWEINDPNFGRRSYVTLDRISPYLLQATIATEDRNFYKHSGVDMFAILRAVYYNLTEGSIVSGASTITQQVARNVLLTEEERQTQSINRKVREAILAVRLADEYTKEEILEVYLNQIYYGNMAYGIEAASQTYFGKEPFAGPALDPDKPFQSLKSARALSLAEAALLAGLPQSPAYHNPYNFPERAKTRQKVVLNLMVEAGYINQEEAKTALNEPVLDTLVPLARNQKAPHFANYVLSELEANPPIGNLNLYEAGLQIQTSLVPELQTLAEEIVAKQVDALADKNVTNGALVALDPTTGQILAMVGSKDFWGDKISGQINMATTPRQPGSSIKPFVYLAAFEKGWDAGTVIQDEPKQYVDSVGNVYAPTNYDLKFHGPVSIRTALANSYNIPAVEAMNFVGVDDFRQRAAWFGMPSLVSDKYYGLALALGAAEMSLLDMTGAYQGLANYGRRIKPHAIARILDSANQDVSPPPAQPVSAMRAEFAYILTMILADNEARTPSFGRNSWLNLKRPAAAKTGTTNDFRDNLVLGYTPDLVVGVWVGNADYSPMRGTTGLSGAGPIWHEFMTRAHEGRPPTEFTRPAGVLEREVCADPSIQAGQHCPTLRREFFAVQGDPLPTPIGLKPTVEATVTAQPTIIPIDTPIMLDTPTPQPTATLTDNVDFGFEDEFDEFDEFEPFDPIEGGGDEFDEFDGFEDEFDDFDPPLN